MKHLFLLAVLSLAGVAQPVVAQSVVERPVRYALILEDEPVATRFAGSGATRDSVQSAAASDYRRQLEAVHTNLRRELASRNLHVSASVATAMNAVFVVATPSRVAELQKLPGVRGVVPLRTYKRQMNRALPLVNASAAWSAVGGVSNAGAGMKIAIIDSGIDQAHVAFQDSSLSMPAGFPKCTPGDCAFTNNKVIVARSYIPMIAAGSDPKNPAADSRPDDLTARDHSGHGTAIAAVAAGNSTTALVTFNGIAPKAYLGSYKIFGSPGVNDGTSDDAIIAALDDAIKDGMDIVSFSIGGEAFTGSQETGAACGLATGVPCDLLAVACENAVKAGTVVVASAGNDGYYGLAYPSFNTIQTPSSAPDVISVGATWNSHIFSETVSLPGNVPSNLQKIAGQSGDANTFYPGAKTLPLLDLQQVGDNGLGCSAFPDGALYGYFVLIKRGTCSYATKVQNVQDAGAMGAVIYMDTNGAPVAPNDFFDDPFLIPFIVIRNSDGVALKAYVDANPLPLATLDSAGTEVIDNLDANELAGFTSIGPSVGDSLIKPDLVATGTSIYTAAQSYDPQGDVYSSTGFVAADGTSFSAPMVAGAAAIVKQKHPAWTPAQIRSALINNAADVVSTDDSSNGDPINVDIQSFGAGLLDAGAAVNATVSANPVSLSFGISPTFPVTKPITLTNNGTSAVTLAISNVQSNGAIGGSPITFDKTSVPLAPGASATVNVTLAGPKPVPSEYSAFVQIQGTGVSMHVPYMYIVPDKTPVNLFQVGGGFDGVPGEATEPRNLAVKLTDDFGAPIANFPVTFTAPDGGKIQNAQATTDQYGIATAQAVLGSAAGFYTYLVDAGPTLELEFDGFARIPPAIVKVENAASYDTTAPVAPGSYISLIGTTLSDYTDRTVTARLPLSIDGVSVSFDVPGAGISVPGHLSYVSATQINVQVPWELAGQTSALMKVTLSSAIGNIFTVPIAAYSPAFFEIAPGVVAAEDLGYAIITSTHPAVHGNIITLYANGLGPVSNTPPSGDPSPAVEPLARTTTAPVVMFGTTAATSVSFSGLTPNIAGLYQINVTVPAGLTPGTYPLTVSIGGKTSKASGIVVQ